MKVTGVRKVSLVYELNGGTTTTIELARSTYHASRIELVIEGAEPAPREVSDQGIRRFLLSDREPSVTISIDGEYVMFDRADTEPISEGAAA